MSDRQAHPYMAYVLRVWRDGPAAPWRAVLVCARTGDRHAFAELADLFAFLEAETDEGGRTAASLEGTGHQGKSQLEEEE